jgi:hypothetical protein
MQFFGSIEFIGDITRNSRQTAPADFDIISEWYRCVKEFYTQEAMCGDYKGSEIYIRIYSQAHRKGSEMLVSELVIDNPYCTDEIPCEVITFE